MLSVIKQYRWIIVAVLACVIGVVHLWVAYQDDKAIFAHGDFTVFYQATKFVNADEAIYGNEAFGKAVQKLRGAEGGARYLYPPFALLIFEPLMLFSYDTAAWLWFAFQLILLVTTILLLPKAVGVRRWSTKELAIALLVLAIFAPIIASLRSGQVNILIMAMLVAQAWALRKHKSILVGLIVAAMILIKLFPVVLLGYYLLKRQWSVVLACLVSLGVLLTLSIGVFGLDTHRDYIERLPKRLSAGIHPEEIARWDNMTVNGLIHRAAIFMTGSDNLTDQQLTYTGWVQLGIIIPLFGLLCYLTYRSPVSISGLLEASAWISFTLFAAKDAHTQYLIMLLPIWLLLVLRTTLNRWWLWSGFLLACLAEKRLFSFLRMPDWFVAIPIGFLANSLFLSYVIWWLWIKRAPQLEPVNPIMKG